MEVITFKILSFLQNAMVPINFPFLKSIYFTTALKLYLYIVINYIGN